jgi:hypothetical protein
MINLKAAVFTVLRDWNLPPEPRKILEMAYYAHSERKWVGLTDNEMFDAMDSYSELENGRKIEQLLKEKNT